MTAASADRPADRLHPGDRDPAGRSLCAAAGRRHPLALLHGCGVVGRERRGPVRALDQSCPRTRRRPSGLLPAGGRRPVHSQHRTSHGWRHGCRSRRLRCRHLLLVAARRGHHRPTVLRFTSAAAVPSVLSILLSPPGTASLAWFAVKGGDVDHVQAAIGAVTLFMLLIQLFSSASTCVCRSLSSTGYSPSRSQCWQHRRAVGSRGGFNGWELAAWTVLGASSVAILLILVVTLRAVARWLLSR